MKREDVLLQNIVKNKKGLEIGPSFRPLVKKRDGFNIKIVDHASAKDLRKKYEKHGVDLDEIEEVDFIFKGQRLPDLVQGQCFDYILASHVIEHVPDLISFLQDCEAILNEHGDIRLAIPDKRFCFDHNRECSSLSRIIDVHETKAKLQTVGAAAEYFLQVCKKNDLIAWDKENIGNITNVHTLSETLEAIKATKNGHYLDIHNWVFTQQSFMQVIMNLRTLKYTSLFVSSSFETIGHEFFIVLKKGSI
jgi:hypothetical protein